MALPQAGATYFQERQGVLRVASILNACQLVFRETPNADVGIDGHVEYVDDGGGATGALVAVQVKSGVSYFDDCHDGVWRYYPSEKHRAYWEAYPLPVILLLHDPRTDDVYWVDVRHQLRTPHRMERWLAVPEDSKLAVVDRIALFEGVGLAGPELMSPPEAAVHMANQSTGNPTFNLSYLDIFLDGVTDVGRKVFFSVGMCWDLAEFRLTPGTGVATGGQEHDFLDDYIRFLLVHALARIDYADVLIDIREREMFPVLLAPLTSRGIAVLDYCHEVKPEGAHSAATEAFIELGRDGYLATRRIENLALASAISAHRGPV